MADHLTDQERAALLTIARAAVETTARGEPLPAQPEDACTPTLEENGCCFVTLHRQGHLRGCIGTFHPGRPLWKTAQEMAVQASSRDPRFRPVAAEEIPEIDLEISVLTPSVPVSDPGEIEVGRDGLIISRGHTRGVLLPQVATENGWDREEFLDHTCRKAGLSAGAWRGEDTTIERFTADVFGEKE